MRNVVVLFGKADENAPNPPSDEEVRECYEYLYHLAGENFGLNMYRASYAWYDDGRKLFKQAMAFLNGRWQTVAEIKPDLVLDRCSALNGAALLVKQDLSKTSILLNCLEFTKLVKDKLNVQMLFSQWVMQTRYVARQKDLNRALDEISTNRVVMKPLDSYGGKGIVIDTKKRICEYKILRPIILQEFVETKDGIPGLVSGRHDLRVTLLNDEVVQTYLREPAQGKLLANVMQGGSEKHFEPLLMPKAALEVVDYARKLFVPFRNKFYSIDFMLTNGGKRAYVVEVNRNPGIYVQRKNYDLRERFYTKLLKYFINTIKSYDE